MIEADLPLLLGLNSLEKANVVLYIGKQKAEIMGNVVEMKRTKSGHYSIEIRAPEKTLIEDVSDFQTVQCLVAVVIR